LADAGSYWSWGSAAGAFNMIANHNSASYANKSTGSRLMYL
jgi:hypothetical protein